MACWIGSYLIFSRPEIPLSYKILRKIKKIDLPQRFKVQEPPKGGFQGPEEIYSRFNALSPAALRKLNAELERSYLRNYAAANEQVPYIKGRFTILDSFELGASDFVTSGVVTLAVASDYPKLLIEHLYCAPANVAPIIKRNLQTGMDIELRRTYELTAVLHVTKLGDGHIQLTVVPLNYGAYVLKGPDGGFSLQPPTELNVAAGWPVIQKARYEQADQAYLSYRTHCGMGPLVGYRETEKKPDTVLKGVDPTPEPSPTATPAPSVQVALVTPTPGKGTPAGKKPTGSPTPALVAKNDTPVPRAVAVTPTPAGVVKATGDNGVSLQPFLQAPSTTSHARERWRRPRPRSPTPRRTGGCIRRASNRAADICGRVSWARSTNTADSTARRFISTGSSRSARWARTKRAASRTPCCVPTPRTTCASSWNTRPTARCRRRARKSPATNSGHSSSPTSRRRPDGTLNVYAREIMD